MSATQIASMASKSGRKPDRASRCDRCHRWVAREWETVGGVVVQFHRLTNPGEWPPRSEDVAVMRGDCPTVETACRRCRIVYVYDLTRSIVQSSQRITGGDE